MKLSDIFVSFIPGIALILLGLALILIAIAGCTDRPGVLKRRDLKEAECVKLCAPRKFKSYNSFFDFCRCVDERK